MGEIKTQFASVYRDFSVDGVAASGLHEPAKSELRALGPLLEQSIATMGLGSMVDVAYATRAALDADIAHNAGAIGLVYADATDANNDLYVKTGASGAGAWTLTSAIHDILAGLTAGYASDADVAAKLAKSANLSDVADPDIARGNISASSQADLDALGTTLAGEMAARAAADTALSAALSAKADSSALTAETSARTAADTALSTAIGTKADTTALTAEVDARKAVIDQVSGDPAVTVAGPDGSEWLMIDEDATRTPALAAEPLPGASAFGLGPDGAALVQVDDATGMISVGPLSFRHVDAPGIYIEYIEDANGNYLADLTALIPEPVIEVVLPTPDLDVFFAPTIVTSPGQTLPIHVASLTDDRDRDVVASVASATTTGAPEDSGGSLTSRHRLDISAARFGAAATLTVHEAGQSEYRYTMPLSLIDVPAGPWPATTPNGLLFGDSIKNRGFGRLLDENLTALGYDVNWIGTMLGAYNAVPPGSAASTAGVLGEARESYSTGHYTYRDLVTPPDLPGTNPIPPGDEAAYLALSKVSQRDYNPIIRAATGGDDPEDVRNGYIVDFDFYQTRFSLSTPDFVLYGLGMNDFLAEAAKAEPSAETLRQTILTEEGLLMRKMREAWPSVKILRWLPTLPYDSVRNSQWTALYTAMIRAVMELHGILADADIILIPSWTFPDPHTGYALASVTADAITGISKHSISDRTHPIYEGWRGLIDPITPYIVAAHRGLI